MNRFLLLILFLVIFTICFVAALALSAYQNKTQQKNKLCPNNCSEDEAATSNAAIATVITTMN